MLTSLPNLLTLSRIVVIPIIIGLFFVREHWAAWTACVLFAAAAITDYIDGYLARSWSQVSLVGKFLDPIADKLLVAAVLFMLVAVDKLNGISVLPAVVILLREVLVSGLREFLAGIRVGMPVSKLAKWKTAIQMVALGILIVGNDGPPWLPVEAIGEIGLVGGRAADPDHRLGLHAGRLEAHERGAGARAGTRHPARQAAAWHGCRAQRRLITEGTSHEAALFRLAPDEDRGLAGRSGAAGRSPRRSLPDRLAPDARPQLRRCAEESGGGAGRGQSGICPAGPPAGRRRRGGAVPAGHGGLRRFMAIRVQAEDFDVGAELAALTDGDRSIGGVTSFVGLVREMGGGPSAMTLEHYPGMTERQLAEIEAEAHARWPLQASLIIHRYGRLEPGDRIVLVATASKHREAAFESCHFLIDWLKTRAPFWKLEETAEGSHWVEAKDSDDAAAEKWKQT